MSSQSVTIRLLGKENMPIEIGLTEAQIKMYSCVLSSVRKHQPLRYPSYRGSIEDLAGDVFTTFMERDVIFNYDHRKSSFEYHIKNLVQNILTDYSRKGYVPTVCLTEHDVDRVTDGLNSGYIDDVCVDVAFRVMREENKKTYISIYEKYKWLIDPENEPLFNRIFINLKENKNK